MDGHDFQRAAKADGQEFRIARDGETIYGKVFYPQGAGPFPLVVFSHGFGASRVYESGMEHFFLQAGFAFAAFDFCGGGPLSQSSGKMTDMSVLTEAADLHAVIDYVKELPQVNAEHLYLMGSSQGGYVASYVAAKRACEVRALVLNFPAFVIEDDAHKRLSACGGNVPETLQIGPHTVGKRYIQDALTVDIYRCIQGYDCDVLILHGADDPIVPVSYSERAVAAFGGPHINKARLEVLPGMGHGFRSATPEIYQHAMELTTDFLKSHEQ